jgi:GH15 family glucan-1,4-alpha-glucosidase
MAYTPIENHAMIGNMHSIALVAIDGTIDWMCMPRFDSPAIFASLLDDKKGGHFRVSPSNHEVTCKQFYWPDTNVLVTRFLSAEGAAELIDFMPVSGAPKMGDEHRHHRLIRRVIAVRGHIDLRMECRPAFNFARDSHVIDLTKDGAIFTSKNLTLGLDTDVALKVEGDAVTADISLAEGESAAFVLSDLHAGSHSGMSLSENEVEDLFRHTVNYWRSWIARCQYRGRWREMVHRSALALKLMTYQPTGAIVAAPTCSLPEGILGQRNWDYRFTWIRDSAFTIYAFLRLGFTEEAEQFMNFLQRYCLNKMATENGPLQIMYGIDGRAALDEVTLTHLDGYRGSKPVRVGNAAYNQLQLDIYGELMDAVYLFNKYGTPISYDYWQVLGPLIDWVCENWRRQDDGIWEVRGGSQDFVYSKLMCWVTLDRGLRLADKRSFPAPRERWLKVRDEIYQEIMSKGWNRERQAFVQYYGSTTLDAANLMMPLVFFLSPTDPRMLKTLDAILQPPEKGGLVSNSLVYRYNATAGIDGLPGDEGTFNICTFWLVEALTRAGRFRRNRLDEARLMFERMLGFTNHVGLYAEETGYHGEGLGNFPQAFTHLALISAAFNLDRALGPGG